MASRRTFLQGVAITPPLRHTLPETRSVNDPGTAEWRFDLPPTVVHCSPPSVVDGTVYTASRDDSPALYAITSDTGEQTWKFEVEGDIPGAPKIVGQTLYCIGDYHTVYAFDRRSGTPVWRSRYGGLGTFDASPVVYRNTVFAATRVGGPSTDETGLLAVNASSGDKQWELETHGGESPLTIYRGRLFTSHGDGGLNARDPRTGSLLWSTDDPLNTIPTVSNGTLFFGDKLGQGEVFALDLKTQTIQWRRQFTHDIGRCMTVADGTVYTGGEGNIYALDAQTGETQWSVETAGTADVTPTVAGDRVFASPGEKSLLALDAATGTRRWEYTAPTEVATAPIVADGTVYVGGKSVHAINAAVDGYSRGSRAALQSLGHHDNLVPLNTTQPSLLSQLLRAVEIF